MARILSSACVALLLCAAGRAWGDKPRLAVLGLEVTPGPTGAVDPAMTQLARDITRDLRARAGAGTSPYAIAPNSNKELTEEKLLMSCDNEATTCMVVIGAGLATDFLLYGHLERKGDVYRVSVKLLDVKAKTTDVGSEDMPIGAQAGVVARKLHARLIGDAQPTTIGSLVVKARGREGPIARGKVMVDQQPRGELAAGRLTVTGMSEGPHTVAIDAPGYEWFEQIATIRAGDQSLLDAVLRDRPSAPAAPSSSHLAWKLSLGTSIAAVVGGGVYAWYAYDGQQRQVPHVNAALDNGSCGRDEQSLVDQYPAIDLHAFHRSCTWHTRIYLGYAVGAAGAVGAIVSLIMLSRDGGSAEPAPTGTRSKKPSVAIAPMITPETIGASLSARW